MLEYVQSVIDDYEYDYHVTNSRTDPALCFSTSVPRQEQRVVLHDNVRKYEVGGIWCRRNTCLCFLELQGREFPVTFRVCSTMSMVRPQLVSCPHKINVWEVIIFIGIIARHLTYCYEHWSEQLLLLFWSSYFCYNFTLLALLTKVRWKASSQHRNHGGHTVAHIY